MKKLISIIVLLTAVAGLSFSQTALAKNGKVEVCHVKEGVVNVFRGATYFTYVGHVIEVSENALDAHIRHGDTEYVDALHNINRPPWLNINTPENPIIWDWIQIADYWGFNLAGVDCSAAVPA